MSLSVDQIPEDDEVFSVRLTGVAGGALLSPNASSVQLRIRRNDSPLRFSQSIMAVQESAGVIALNVIRGRLTEDGPIIGSVDSTVSLYQTTNNLFKYIFTVDYMKYIFNSISFSRRNKHTTDVLYIKYLKYTVFRSL